MTKPRRHTELSLARRRVKLDMPIDIDEFARETDAMRPDQVRAFIQIQFALWRSIQLHIPDRPSALIAAAKVTPQWWRYHGEAILARLYRTNMGWSHLGLLQRAERARNYLERTARRDRRDLLLQQQGKLF